MAFLWTRNASSSCLYNIMPFCFFFWDEWRGSLVFECHLPQAQKGWLRDREWWVIDSVRDLFESFHKDYLLYLLYVGSPNGIHIYVTINIYIYIYMTGCAYIVFICIVYYTLSTYYTYPIYRTCRISYSLHTWYWKIYKPLPLDFFFSPTSNCASGWVFSTLRSNIRYKEVTCDPDKGKEGIHGGLKREFSSETVRVPNI